MFSWLSPLFRGRPPERPTDEPPATSEPFEYHPVVPTATSPDPEPQEGSKMYFEIYRDARREFRWRLIAGNGRTVAVSGEGYKNRQGCLKGIRAVQKSADALIEELDDDETDK